MSREIVIGRQPIFNRDYQVVAYELLFRGEGEYQGENMTAQVIVNTMLDMGIEKVAGSLPVFINIDEDFLIHGTELAHALPKESVVLEILESVPATPEVLAACAALKKAGYRLAVDDVCTLEHALAFVDYVSIIKLEWPDLKDSAEMISRLRQHNVSFLAEKVDNYEDAERAQALDVEYYQGYFFCKPANIKATKPPESRMSVLRAMQQSLTATSVDQMFSVVKQDVTISFRLLKYINSAAFGLRREVESIEQALALLGLRNIQRWLTLLTMTSLAENKPKELIRQALYRAHFLEKLARVLGESEVEDDFLMGLFSVLDALLDCPMEQSISDMPLSEHIRQGLTNPDSAMGAKLALVRALETGNWQTVASFTVDGTRVHYDEITRLHSEAAGWADTQMNALDMP